VALLVLQVLLTERKVLVQYFLQLHQQVAVRVLPTQPLVVTVVQVVVVAVTQTSLEELQRQQDKVITVVLQTLTAVHLVQAVAVVLAQ
jgi:hypothetical protein